MECAWNNGVGSGRVRGADKSDADDEMKECARKLCLSEWVNEYVRVCVYEQNMICIVIME